MCGWTFSIFNKNKNMAKQQNIRGMYSYSNRHRMHKFMKYEELQTKVIKWAEDRNILENSNAIKQISKTQEELDETLDALKRLEQGEESILEVADGIGDMLVTIILLAKTVGLDSVDCLADAYDEIKERKGKMVDGLFVKE
jgi:NTP pyrophosphatase (non-canonical NTP hydrolase)